MVRREVLLELHVPRHDRPRNAGNLVCERNRNKLEGFLRQQGSGPVRQLGLGLAILAQSVSSVASLTKGSTFNVDIPRRQDMGPAQRGKGFPVAVFKGRNDAPMLHPRTVKIGWVDCRKRPCAMHFLCGQTYHLGQMRVAACRE